MRPDGVGAAGGRRDGVTAQAEHLGPRGDAGKPGHRLRRACGRRRSRGRSATRGRRRGTGRPPSPRRWGRRATGLLSAAVLRRWCLGSSSLGHPCRTHHLREILDLVHEAVSIGDPRSRRVGAVLALSEEVRRARGPQRVRSSRYTLSVRSASANRASAAIFSSLSALATAACRSCSEPPVRWCWIPAASTKAFSRAIRHRLGSTWVRAGSGRFGVRTMAIASAIACATGSVTRSTFTFEALLRSTWNTATGNSWLVKARWSRVSWVNTTTCRCLLHLRGVDPPLRRAVERDRQRGRWGCFRGGPTS